MTAENNFLYLKQSSNLNMLNRVNKVVQEEGKCLLRQEGKTKTLISFKGEMRPKTLQLNDLLLASIDLNTGETLLDVRDISRLIPYDKNAPLKDLKKDIDTLISLNLTFDKGRTSYKRMNLFKSIEVLKGGILTASYNDDFLEYLKKSCKLMAYNENIFKLDCRKKNHPYSYFLSHKLMELQRMNMSKEWMTVSVKTLLELCKKVGMSDWKKTESRRRKREIIEPLLKDLQYLEENNIIEYELDILINKPELQFSDFLKGNFRTRLIDYPKFRILQDEENL